MGILMPTTSPMATTATWPASPRCTFRILFNKYFGTLLSGPDVTGAGPSSRTDVTSPDEEHIHKKPADHRDGDDDLDHERRRGADGGAEAGDGRLLKALLSE